MTMLGLPVMSALRWLKNNPFYANIVIHDEWATNALENSELFVSLTDANIGNLTTPENEAPSSPTKGRRSALMLYDAMNE